MIFTSKAWSKIATYMYVVMAVDNIHAIPHLAMCEIWKIPKICVYTVNFENFCGRYQKQ